MKPSSSTSSESSVLDGNGYNLVHEKYDYGEGGRLTSVKPADDYEQNLRQGEKEKKSNVSKKEELDLVSGRKAAAGWERSG
jgi:2-acylglycerol O-acyltransferase 2